MFERGKKLGGLWASTLEAEGEESGDADEKSQTSKTTFRRVHSSVYPSLRTNLPRILMGFTSYHFTKDAMALTAAEEKRNDGEEEEEEGNVDKSSTSEDFRAYPGHAAVLRYLQAYSDEFDLEKFVKYGRELVRASPVFSPPPPPPREGGGIGEESSPPPPPPLPWPRWLVVTRATVPAGDTGDAFLAFGEEHERSGDESYSEEVFDALVCCSGHFAVPRFPPSAVAAMEAKRQRSPSSFPGLILHAHSYRGPGVGPLAKVLMREEKKKETETEREEIVVAVVGAGPSGEDIAREISPLADRVLLCSAAWENVPFPRGEKRNIEPRPFVVGLDEQGRVHFGGRDEGRSDGVSPSSLSSSPSSPSSSPSLPPPERVDAVVYATGYLYDFPELSGAISVEDNEVLQGGMGEVREGGGEGERPNARLPLWEHLFPPALAPGLSLLGLPFKVVPFPLVEAQARLVARALAFVPNEEEGGEEEEEGEAQKGISAAFPWPRPEMAAAAVAASRQRAEKGVARRHTHRMGGPSHFEYVDRLVDAAEALGGGGGGGGGDENGAVGGGGVNSSSPSPCPPSNWRLAPWRQEMYVRASEARRLDADSYRDTAELGEETVRQAEADAEAWLRERRRKGKGKGSSFLENSAAATVSSGEGTAATS